jgi:NAD+ synthase (glutamine-hydrolysing)
MRQLRIGMAQINTTVGDFAGNTQKILGAITQSEYKRRQAPPGIKITPRAFGRDRRLPITNRFKG